MWKMLMKLPAALATRPSFFLSSRSLCPFLPPSSPTAGHQSGQVNAKMFPSPLTLSQKLCLIRSRFFLFYSMVPKYPGDKENLDPKERRGRREAKTERRRKHLILAIHLHCSSTCPFCRSLCLGRAGHTKGFSYFPGGPSWQVGDTSKW